VPRERSAKRWEADAQVEVARFDYRLKLWIQILRVAQPVGCVLAATLPLWMVERIVHDLAGKTTTANVKLGFSLTITASLMVNGLQYLQGRSRRNEIKRLRGRVERLEGPLLAEKKADPSLESGKM
jgi:hypothetical protein